MPFNSDNPAPARGWKLRTGDGYIIAGPVDEHDNVEILELWVEPHARRRGVGRGLVEEARRWAAGQGAARVLVQTGPRNEGAQAFWAAMGLRPVAIVHQAELVAPVPV